MPTLLKYRKNFSVYTLCIMTFVANLISIKPANAEYFQPVSGNYIGGGVIFQNNNNNNHNGGHIQGRIQILNAPISIRGTVYFLDNSDTVVSPTITYDMPIWNNINFYIGGGVFLSNETKAILTVGGEFALSKNIVVYGDLNGFGSGNISKLGIGYRF
jgi:hypothetical protein